MTGSANRARLVLFGALLLAGFCLWQLRKEVQNVVLLLAAKLVKAGWFECHEQNSQEALQADPIKAAGVQQ